MFSVFKVCRRRGGSNNRSGATTTALSFSRINVLTRDAAITSNVSNDNNNDNSNNNDNEDEDDHDYDEAPLSPRACWY